MLPRLFHRPIELYVVRAPHLIPRYDSLTHGDVHVLDTAVAIKAGAGEGVEGGIGHGESKENAFDFATGLIVLGEEFRVLATAHGQQNGMGRGKLLKRITGLTGMGIEPEDEGK
jgi:hypothetical protein